MTEHPAQEIPYPGTEAQMAEVPQDEMRGRMNAVALRPLGTPLNPATFPEETVKGFGSDTPMDRAAQPDEIAPSLVFFAGNRLSSYYTGGVLAPVGGQTMPG